jgi:hypothetical protein
LIDPKLKMQRVIAYYKSPYRLFIKNFLNFLNTLNFNSYKIVFIFETLSTLNREF